MSPRSPDPIADRFIDRLLADTKRINEARRAAEEPDEIEGVDPLGAALAETGEAPESIKALLDEPDQATAIGKFMRRKLMEGV